MAKKQTADGTPDAAPVEVRALVDDALHGLESGKVALIPADSVEALKAQGLVDDHPDAVAYARSLV